jgi:hypothetical protein
MGAPDLAALRLSLGDLSRGLGGGPDGFSNLTPTQRVRVLAYDNILADPKGEKFRGKKQGDRGASILSAHLDKVRKKRGEG